MKRWTPIAVLASLATIVLGNEVQIKQDDANRQRCSGMYARSEWAGPVDPFILIKFLPLPTTNPPASNDSDPLASLILFEWRDEELIGRLPDNAQSYLDKETICDQANVDRQFCTSENIGQFILVPNATEKAHNPIANEAIHLRDPKVINYPIRRTGYYCVSTYAFSNQDYTAVVEWRNAFGELPAAQIAKLPFYAGLTIAYALLISAFGFLYVKHRSDVLPVQNYIAATLLFLVVEQLMTWGFYDYQNRHGNTIGNKIYLVVVAVLNAGRISLSFFLLLIVCMGYGVVKPSLGKTMIYVRILAIVHFVFGVIYAIASLAVTPDTVGPIVLFVILPLAGTLTAFYVWTLSSLNATMKDLIDRKQKTKALMYKRLWWCLLSSIMVIFGFFFYNSFALAGSSEADFIPNHWRGRWFVLDGWLNCVYFVDVAFIAYLWRPTENNRRFAMSDELAQEDDGFDLRSVHSRDSLDDLDSPDDPNNAKRREAELDLERDTFGGSSTAEANRGAPSKPLGQHPPSSKPRQSLDGETIFAVGDEDAEWSEGEPEDEDDGEGKRMVKKS
ncbi:Membrane protein PTM1 [Cyphellophora attinorum]|uniref:Membrane protein PTM1 n=1 Tax=Cyphellophora attinorum TaxID=1664694 RepID=A0A0N1HLX4_9EURO|nr:Membrane protein PTM1 [Phialophora attinorum]KPI38127.1 Membrane protein PTM1 [Phialophora attinorum]